MSWLGVLGVLVSLASSLTTYLHDKEMMEAGEALAIIEGLKYAQTAINKANQARRTAQHKFDELDGVQDDTDPNLRD